MTTFKKIFTKKVTAALFAGFLATALIVAGLSFLPSKTHATGLTGDLHGYAWSDTIGWVSLNCADAPGGCSSHSYKVTLSNDNLTGYAWSDAVGWIGFNSSNVTSPVLCGTGHAGFLDDTNTTHPTTANITGWSRVVSGTVASGADGCISLSGGTGASAYGLKYDAATPSTLYAGNTLTGYAWGSVNTGWLNFDYASLDAAVTGVNLQVTKDTTYPDQSVIPHATGVKIGSYKLKNLSGTEGVGLTNLTVGMATTGVTLSDVTNLKLQINSVPEGTAVSSLSTSNAISVAPYTLGPGATVQVDVYADFGTATSGTVTSSLIAAGNGLVTLAGYSSGAAVTGQTVTIIPSLPPSTVILKINGSLSSAFPTSAGGAATLTWEAATNVTHCTAVTDTFGPETYWTPTTPATVSLTTGLLGPNTIPAFSGSSSLPNKHYFGLNCSISGGTPIPEVTAEIDVPSPAVTASINFQVNYLSSFTFPDSTGGAASLTWNTSGMASCTPDTTQTITTYWPSGSAVGAGPSTNAIVVPANTSLTTDATYPYGIKCTDTIGGIHYASVSITVPRVGATPTTGTGSGGTGSPATPPWKEL